MAALTIFRGWAHAEPSTPVTQRSPCLRFFLNLIKYLFRLGATPPIPTATATARVPGHPDLGRAAQRDPLSFCRTTKTTTTVATSAQRNQKNAPGWVYRMRIKNPESTFKAYNFWLAKDIEKLQTSLKSYMIQLSKDVCSFSVSLPQVDQYLSYHHLGSKFFSIFTCFPLSRLFSLSFLRIATDWLPIIGAREHSGLNYW